MKEVTKEWIEKAEGDWKTALKEFWRKLEK